MWRQWVSLEKGAMGPWTRWFVAGHGHGMQELPKEQGTEKRRLELNTRARYRSGAINGEGWNENLIEGNGYKSRRRKFDQPGRRN